MGQVFGGGVHFLSSQAADQNLLSLLLLPSAPVFGRVLSRLRECSHLIPICMAVPYFELIKN